MIDVDAMTHEAELQALKDLVESDGWKVLQAHVAQAWGDAACLQQIDATLAKDHDPGDEIAITRRIRDTFKGVRAEASWVRSRITELEGIVKDKKEARSFVDRFAGLRRVPRS